MSTELPQSSIQLDPREVRHLSRKPGKYLLGELKFGVLSSRTVHDRSAVE